MWDLVGLDNLLPGEKMPPKIGIDGISCRHGEQAKEQDSGEGCALAGWRNSGRSHLTGL
jgi:hypothetical protein